MSHIISLKLKLRLQLHDRATYYTPSCTTFYILHTQYILELYIHLFIQDPLRYDIVTTIISNVLPPLNSCINPFVYFIFSAHFRVAFKDFLFKLVKSHRHALNMYGEESCAVPLVAQQPFASKKVVGHQRWSLTQLPRLMHAHQAGRRKSCVV